MRKTARWIKAMPWGERGWWVRQHLFKVSPPVEFEVQCTYRKGKILDDGIGSKSMSYRMRMMNRKMQEAREKGVSFFELKPDPAYQHARKTRRTSFVIASAADLKSMMEKSRREIIDHNKEKKWYLESRLDVPEEQKRALIDSLEEVISLFERQTEFEVETYLFPSDKFGKVKNGGELPGSQRGTLDHAVPFRDEGYEVIGMPLNLKSWEGCTLPEYK